MNEYLMFVMDSGAQSHHSAIIDAGTEAHIGKGTKIWHFSHVSQHSEIGENCILGQNVFVAEGVKIGNGCKIQNNVSLYTGVVLEDDVFLGPSCVLTNVSNPRCQVDRKALYEKTLIRRGATIGANATIICGVTIGRYAFIAAGAVVTKDVQDYEFACGVPAVVHGWVSRHGHRLHLSFGCIMTCPESGYSYELYPGHRSTIHCLDLDEDAPLPEELAVGTKSYREFKEVT